MIEYTAFLATRGRKGNSVRAAARVVVLIVSAVATAVLAGEPPPALREENLKALGLELGALVQRLDDGTNTYERGADKPMNVASNTKLVLSAAALHSLGPWHRFETTVFEGPGNGLCIKGGGDPSIEVTNLHAITRELTHSGLREVKGDLILDESFFDNVRLPPGYAEEEVELPYTAPTGALSLNRNVIAVYARRSEQGSVQVSVEPSSAYIDLDAKVTTKRCNATQITVKSQAVKDRQRIEVRGCISAKRPLDVSYRKIDDPARFFGHTLREVFALHGVNVKGAIKPGLCAPNAKALHVHRSPPLSELLAWMNKYSSNFIAEQVLKSMGALRAGVPGTTAKGLEEVAAFLEGLGIARGTYKMLNGSGLNDTNRFSPRQLVTILAKMRGSEVGPEYVSSLSISGHDGTLKSRFDHDTHTGKLRAKTGTLAGVSALAGYVRGEGAQIFAFALVVNGAGKNPRQMRQAFDEAVDAVITDALGTTPPQPESGMAAVLGSGLLDAVGKLGDGTGRKSTAHERIASTLAYAERIARASKQLGLDRAALGRVLAKAAAGDPSAQACAAALSRAASDERAQDTPDGIDEALWMLDTMPGEACTLKVTRNSARRIAEREKRAAPKSVGATGAKRSAAATTAVARDAP